MRVIQTGYSCDHLLLGDNASQNTSYITKICVNDTVPVDLASRKRIYIVLLLEEIRHQAQTCGWGPNTLTAPGAGRIGIL